MIFIFIHFQVNIQVHFAVKHSNECKVYKCTRCTSVFRSEMECQLHVKVHHLGVSKPYRCFFCKDSFAVESDLQTHVTTHKKQFVCPICHEAFLVEYLLDKHLETKHSSPDVPLGNGSGRQDISVVASLLVPSHSLPPDGVLLSMQTTSPSSIASEKRTSVSPSSFVGGVSSPSSRKGDLIYKCEVSHCFVCRICTKWLSISKFTCFTWWQKAIFCVQSSKAFDALVSKARKCCFNNSVGLCCITSFYL